MNTKVTVQEVVDVLNSERHEWDKLRHIFAHRIQTHGIEVAYTPMTDKDLMETFDSADNARDGRRAIHNAVIDRLGVAPSLDQAKRVCEEAGLAVVPVEDCKSCDNTGKLSMGYMSGQYNCHCRRNPASRFNQNKAMLEAARGAK